LVLGRGRIRPAEEEAPVGDVGVAGPDLLAADDELVPLSLGATLERGQVRARTGLREALAPQLTAGDHGREVAVALRGRAVLADRRADQIDVRLRGRAWGAHLVQRRVEQPALALRRAAAAVLAGPRDHRPASVEQLPLPVARDALPERILDPRPAVVAPPLAWAVGLEPTLGLG